jgi:hypothetical protein
VSSIAAIIRIVFGLAAAGLAAGLVQVLFVAGEDLAGGISVAQAQSLGLLMLLAGAQSAVFAAPFVIAAAIFAARRPIRSPYFYLALGAIAAAAGFAAHYGGDEAPSTIFNRYALAAYVVSGLAGGFFYWFLAVPKRPATAD